MTERKTEDGLKTIVSDPHILDRFYKDFCRNGAVGEKRNAKLLYLILTTRFFENPVSLFVHGAECSGKSFLVNNVLEFFPPSSYVNITAENEHDVLTAESSNKSRFAVIDENALLRRDHEDYMQCLNHAATTNIESIDKTTKFTRKRLLQKKCNGVIFISSKSFEDYSTHTRFITTHTDHSKEQTRNILIAKALDKRGIQLKRWQDYQEWLSKNVKPVVIPFAPAIANLLVEFPLKMRNDFDRILTLIKAHALIHQENRKIDERGSIIATLKDDYEPVKELIQDLMIVRLFNLHEPPSENTFREQFYEFNTRVKEIYENLGSIKSELPTRKDIDKFIKGNYRAPKSAVSPDDELPEMNIAHQKFRFRDLKKRLPQIKQREYEKDMLKQKKEREKKKREEERAARKRRREEKEKLEKKQEETGK